MADIADADPSRRALMVEILSGRGGTARPNPYFDTPTEPMQAFARCLEACGGDPARLDALAQAIVELSAEPDYSWFSAYYLLDLLEHQARFGGPARVQRIVDAVLDNVAGHRAHLRALRRWAGAEEADGCWAIVDRFVRGLADPARGVEVRWPRGG